MVTASYEQCALRKKNCKFFSEFCLNIKKITQ